MAMALLMGAQTAIGALPLLSRPPHARGDHFPLGESSMNPARYLAACLGGIALVLGSVSAQAQSKWIGIWQASPVAAPTVTAPPIVGRSVVKGLLRFRVKPTSQGTALRLRLSNEYGAAPLVIGGASIAIAAEDFSIRPGSSKPVTFGGRTSITMAPGAPVVSDPVPFELKPTDELVVTVSLPDDTTFGPGRTIKAQSAATGSLDDAVLEGGKPVSIRPVLTGVDALGPKDAAVIVAFGDSITDGLPVDMAAFRGWPELLAGRFAARAAGKRPAAIVNAGIAGNRLLLPTGQMGFGAAGLARFDRDVLAVPGVTHVIVLIGINDLGLSKGVANTLGDGGFPEMLPTAEEMIAGYQQLITRAHLAGITAIGVTIPPFEGALYYSEDREAVRQKVNEWIRISGRYDAVVDFDALLQDKDRPTRLAPRFDAGDKLHPGPAGLKAMADAFDLSLFD
jgi:lysophospholipase L1-like esterase